MSKTLLEETNAMTEMAKRYKIVEETLACMNRYNCHGELDHAQLSFTVSDHKDPWPTLTIPAKVILTEYLHQAKQNLMSDLIAQALLLVRNDLDKAKSIIWDNEEVTKGNPTSITIPNTMPKVMARLGDSIVVCPDCTNPVVVGNFGVKLYASPIDIDGQGAATECLTCGRKAELVVLRKSEKKGIEISINSDYVKTIICPIPWEIGEGTQHHQAILESSSSFTAQDDGRTFRCNADCPVDCSRNILISYKVNSTSDDDKEDLGHNDQARLVYLTDKDNWVTDFDATEVVLPRPDGPRVNVSFKLGDTKVSCGRGYVIFNPVGEDKLGLKVRKKTFHCQIDCGEECSGNVMLIMTSPGMVTTDDMIENDTETLTVLDTSDLIIVPVIVGDIAMYCPHNNCGELMDFNFKSIGMEIAYSDQILTCPYCKRSFKIIATNINELMHTKAYAGATVIQCPRLSDLTAYISDSPLAFQTHPKLITCQHMGDCSARPECSGMLSVQIRYRSPTVSITDPT